MFDRYEITRGTETRLVPYEKTVHEHRAPTDESIKIYDEMREKAALSLIDSRTIADTVLNGVVNLHEDHYTGDRYVCFKFKVNGRVLEGYDKLELVDGGMPSMHDAMDYAVRSLARGIAAAFANTMIGMASRIKDY